MRADAFLEWADVFGNLYGTGCSRHGARLARRPGPGARDRRPGRAAGPHALPETVGVFVLPPSFEVLEQRLRGRSKDSEAAMQRRLQTARDEVAAFVEYDYVVVNDELEACVERLRAIVLAERARLRIDARRWRKQHRQVIYDRTELKTDSMADTDRTSRTSSSS